MCKNGYILTPWRFPYENSLAWFVTICKKASPRARANAQGPQFPLAFQLAILQVDDYSVYGSMEGRPCGNFGPNSVLSGHQNAFSNRFSCRLATTPGKSAIAMWINKFREHGAIHNLNSKISMTLRHSGSSKCIGTPGNITKVMESVAKSLKVKRSKKSPCKRFQQHDLSRAECMIGIWRSEETFFTSLLRGYVR